MPKFTFKCEHEGLRTDDVVITNTTEFRGETLDEVLENFERFLKGSGYFFDGQLDFVKEDNFEKLRIILTKNHQVVFLLVVEIAASLADASSYYVIFSDSLIFSILM